MPDAVLVGGDVRLLQQLGFACDDTSMRHYSPPGQLEPPVAVALELS